VVVDNSSKDGSVEMLLENFHEPFVIRNNKNLGFSKANNQGIRYALAKGAKDVLLLNNDIEVPQRKWLQTSLMFSSETQKSV
jgi:hypothetical protein